MHELSTCTTIDELFHLWRTHSEGRITNFIEDGIVCEQEYALPHILFIMRDMNTSKPDSLRSCLAENGSGWRTWNNAARWVHGLLTGEEIYPRQIDRRTEMRKAAVINLKKESGGPHAVFEQLKAAVQNDPAFILREIELCDPDIIICGGFGNASLLKEYVLKDQSGPWSQFPALSFDHQWSYYIAHINNKEVPIISFCHPQVTNFKGKRGHSDLFEPLYREMLNIRTLFLGKTQ